MIHIRRAVNAKAKPRQYSTRGKTIRKGEKRSRDGQKQKAKTTQWQRRHPKTKFVITIQPHIALARKRKRNAKTFFLLQGLSGPPYQFFFEILCLIQNHFRICYILSSRHHRCIIPELQKAVPYGSDICRIYNTGTSDVPNVVICNAPEIQ